VTKPPYDDLSRRARRRHAYRALLRSVLATASLVAVYFVVPLDGQFTVVTAVALACGLLAFGGIVAWQARAVTRSPYPSLRAMEALATSIPFFLLLYATSYVLMSDGQAGAFSEPLDRVDALYFTVTVFATVGFGDITPDSPPARILAMTQMLGDLLVVGLVARVLLGAVKVARDRQADS
jgi:voltage-gated potassium channel